MNLYFEKHGSGRPIVLLHGFGATLYTWHWFMPSLEKMGGVFAIDLKGHGKSPKPNDHHYSPHDQAELIANFITEHNLRDITLVGHSYGGGVALLTALKLNGDAGRIKNLILIAPGAYPQRLPWFMLVFKIPLIRELLHFVPARYMMRSVLKDIYYDKSKIEPATVRAYTEPNRDPNYEPALKEMIKTMIPSDIKNITDSYPSLKMPALIIWGDKDTVVPYSTIENLSKALPNSKLEIIKNCGHAPQEETPVEVSKILKSFSS